MNWEDWAMTLNKSFFNKGIYKSTIKRFAWGSVLYFILLFMSTALLILLDNHMIYDANSLEYYRNNPIILTGGYMGFPMFFAVVVPTFTALMVFRFLHSKKHAIFIHSIPVSRNSNFISSVAASFTLMYLPVILNGLILIIMSFSGFDSLFSTQSCIVWMLINMYAIFLMFSCAVFAACLTGNSFAMIAINVIIHIFVFVTVSAFSIMAEEFVYGFSQSNDVIESIATNNFAYKIMSFSSSSLKDISFSKDILPHLFAATAFYISSYFLYKKRRIETAGDVAGFNCLNHIFKYIVTFLATVFGFALFSPYTNNSLFMFSVILIIISITSYTASEMVLRKTLRVFYAWKGYLIFALAFVSITLIFSHTSFFGYETRIPDKKDIDKACIYNYYYHENEPYICDEEIINMILGTHSEFIKPSAIPNLLPDNNYGTQAYTRLHIKYILKDGSTLERVYPIKNNDCIKIMNKFYENEKYKKVCEKVFMDDTQITRVFADGNEESVKDYKELVECIRKDVLLLSYEELHPYNYKTYNVYRSIIIEFMQTEKSYIDRIYIDVTDKYTNTIKWLNENGYIAF